MQLANVNEEGEEKTRFVNECRLAGDKASF